MKQPTFLSLILALMVIWMQVYGSARETYNEISDYKAALENLQKETEAVKLASSLDHEHFLEFRQGIATLMPEVLKEKGEGEEGYPFRNLASVISRKESDQVRRTVAKALFERGKEFFRQKQYAKANHAFKQIIDRFSYTSYVTESYFLMAEGHFLSNELEECTVVVQQMVELFPAHELTGFALIRLGRIYETQNRNEEAIDIYKTVLRSFPQRDVASQARSSLKGVDL